MKRAAAVVLAVFVCSWAAAQQTSSYAMPGGAPRHATKTTMEIRSEPDFGSATAVATVSGLHGVPTGVVSFVSGKTEVGRVSLDAMGQATINVPADGDATGLEATYLGDTTYQSSASSALRTAGTTAPALTASPTAIAFGGQGIGTTSAPAQKITLTNSGNAALSFTGFALGGTNASDYALTSNTCKLAPSTLAAGASCALTVTFAPAATGPSSAVFTISSNLVSGPVNLPLSGTGVNGPFASLPPSPVVFATQVVGVAAARTLTLKNTGNATLNLSSLALSGTNATEFTRAGTCKAGTALAQGASCTIVVTLRPKSIGSKTAALTVTDDAADSPQVLTLTGNAVDAPFIKAAPVSLKFGSTQVGNPSAPLGIVLSNIGDRPLHISGFTFVGAAAAEFAASAPACSATINPGASCSASVTFTPAKVGSRAASLSVASDALNNPFLLAVSGTGTNTAFGTLSATALSFGVQAVGKASQPQTLTLSNTGTATLAVTGVALSGGFPADYVATPDPGCASIGPSGSCTISVVFTPGATGARGAKLAIQTNANTLPLVTLSGTGTNAPIATLSASTVSFGTQPVGQQTAPMTVVLTNTGGAPLSITSMVFSGTNPLDFAQTTDCPLSPATLLIGGSCNINVTFTARSVGARSATLTINDNAAVHPQTIALSGTGAAIAANAVIVIMPSAVTFTPAASGTVVIGTAAPAAGQQVFLSSNNTGIFCAPNGLPSFVTVPSGQQSVNFSFCTSGTAGTATVTGFISNNQSGTTNVQVTNRQINFTLPSPVLALGTSVTPGLSLVSPAQTGGAIINLASSDTTTATVAPAKVTFAAGKTTTAAAIQINGAALGTATITASAAAGYSPAAVGVRVVDPNTYPHINLGQNITVAPGQTLTLPVSLSQPAAQTVTINLLNANPAFLTAPASVVIPAGSTAPAVAPQIVGLAFGTAKITAVDPSGTFVSGTQGGSNVKVDVGLSFSPPTINVFTSNTASATLNLSAPAPAAGYTATLNSANTGLATVPATVTFAPFTTFVTVPVTGIAQGNTTLQASIAGASTPATVPLVVAPAPALTLFPTTVGKDLETTTSGALSSPAPAGGVNITVTSTDPTQLLLSTSATAAGSASINLQVGAGNTGIPSFYVQSLAGAGAVTITATGSNTQPNPGGPPTVLNYAPGSAAVTLVPSGFYVSPTSFSTSVGLADTTISLAAAPLDPVTLGFVNFNPQYQPLRGGLAQVNVSLTMTLSGSGTLSTNPISISGGSASGSTAFHALASGSTTISLVQPVGFTAPASQTQVGVVVNGTGFVPPSTISLGNALQTSVSVTTLSSPAPAGNLNVTVTSSDSTRVALSADPTAAGVAQLTLQVPAGSQAVPGFYVQAVPTAGGGTPTGTVTIQMQAPGFGTGSFDVNLVPTGMILFAGCNASTLSTTNLSSNSQLAVVLTTIDASGEPTLINNSLCYAPNQTLAPGFAPVVNITSDTPSVGTVTSGGGGVPSIAVQFNTNDVYKPAAFHPIAPGSAILSIDTPAGFGTPLSDQQVQATVTASSLYVSSVPVGWGLETPISVSLATAAPPGNEQITLTSADPTKMVLSLDPTTAGTQSVTAIIYAGTSSPSVPVYVQALNGAGINVNSSAAVDITATSTDFGQTTNTVSLVPAGFVLSLPYPQCFAPSFTTTTTDADTGLVVYAVPLDPATGAFTGASPYCYNPVGEQVNPLAAPAGAPVNVNLSSSLPGFGTITSTPVSFNAGDAVQNSGFHPLSPGDTTVALSGPAPQGFSTPSNYQQIAASVTLPNQTMTVTMSAADVGNNLQAGVSAYLSPAAATDTVITVTSGDPNRLLLSTDPTVLGSTSVTVNVLAGSGRSATPIYEQALANSGTVTLTATSPGYSFASATVNLLPSGFILSASPCLPSSFDTTLFSSDQPLSVYSVPLDPSTLNFHLYYCYPSTLAQPLRPGVGPVSVPVTTAPGSGGSITQSPLVFNTGDTGQDTAFHPTAIGTETISVGAPSAPGFSTPGNYQQVTANITTPGITVYAPGALGKDLQGPVYIYLSVPAPAPAGLDVLVASSDASRILLSADPSGVGSSSVTVNIPVGASGSNPIYAQGLMSNGAVTLTASASGFNPGTAVVPMQPTGVILTAAYCQTSPTTSVLLGDSSLNVYLSPLDPVTLNAQIAGYYLYCPPAGYNTLRPGAAPIAVNVSSDNTAVGTVTSSSLVIQPGQSSQPTGFHPVSDGAANVSVNTPAGLTKPSNFQNVAFNVVPAALYINDVVVGCNMQTTGYISLGVGAPAGTTLTLHSQDVTKLQLSADPALAGSSTISFAFTGGESYVMFYVQARNANCVLPPGASSIADIGYTATVTGPGADYAPGTATVHVMPSGFAITGVNSNFFTTLSSADTSLQLTPVALDPTYLNVLDFEQLVPGLTNTRVPVITSARCGGSLDQTVGAITVSPVVFNGADVPNYQNTSFHPVSVGATVVYVPAIPGFSQASNDNCVTANVQ